MKKSPDAFRTISEVADWLGTPTHVLRFWESRFTQVKPVKRAGGRRYYRPKDMELLGGIRKLLHDDGMTIRGVQKLLRKEGVRHVSGFSHPVDTSGAIEMDAPDAGISLDVASDEVENVVPLKDTSRIQALAKRHAAAPASEAPQKSDPAEQEPERGPRGDILTGPDEDHIAATKLAEEKAAEPPRPIIADVPDDPADDAPAPSPLDGIAAALRKAARANAPRPAPSEALTGIHIRLLALKKSMDQGQDPDPAN